MAVLASTVAWTNYDRSIASPRVFDTYRRITLPLIAPTIFVVALIDFVGSARNIAQVALLSNSANRPLAMLHLADRRTRRGIQGCLA